MNEVRTTEQQIEATRALICEIARVWGVTCLDIDASIRVADDVTIVFGAAEGAGNGE